MKMDRQKFEQHCAIKFCVKLGDSAAVTYERLQRAYGEHSLSGAQVFRWHKFFLEGREQVEDEPRAGRPSTSKTDDTVNRMRSFQKRVLKNSEINFKHTNENHKKVHHSCTIVDLFRKGASSMFTS